MEPEHLKEFLMNLSLASLRRILRKRINTKQFNDFNIIYQTHTYVQIENYSVSYKCYIVIALKGR